MDKTQEIALEIKNTVATLKEATAQLQEKTGAETLELKAQIDELLVKLAQQNSELDAVKQAIAGGEKQEVEQEAKSIGAQFVTKSSDLSAMSNSRNTRVTLNTKAALVNGEVLGGHQHVAPVLQERPIVAGIRALVPATRIDSDLISYVREKLVTDNTGMVKEGDKKPQSVIEYELVESSPKVIAHFIKTSKQALSDNSFLAGQIDNTLLSGVAKKEEEQILLGDGTGQNLLGLVPQATKFDETLTEDDATVLDVLRMAMAQLNDNDFVANGIVLNSMDAAKLSLMKDTTGRYIIESVDGSVSKLWGVDVYASTKMTKGQFLVADFNQTAILDRWDATVEAGYENDDFTRNMVTLLGEERIGLAVYNTNALVTGSF